MKCIKCGETLIEGMDICISCGASQTSSQPVRMENEQVVQSIMSKKKLGLIAIFLGFVGAHNFILGYTGKGILQILLTLSGFGFFIALLWGLFEGLMILGGKIDKYKNGQPIIQVDF